MKNILFFFLLVFASSCEKDSLRTLQQESEYRFEIKSYSPTTLQYIDGTSSTLVTDVVSANYVHKWKHVGTKYVSIYTTPMLNNFTDTYTVALYKGDVLLVKKIGISNCAIAGEF